MTGLHFLAEALIGSLGEGFRLREFGLSFGAFAHGLIEAREAPVHLHISRRDLLGGLEVVEGGGIVASLGVEDAEIEPGEFLAGVELQRFLNQRAGVVGTIEADAGVGPVGNAFGIAG